MNDNLICPLNKPRSQAAQEPNDGARAFYEVTIVTNCKVADTLRGHTQNLSNPNDFIGRLVTL